MWIVIENGIMDEMRREPGLATGKDLLSSFWHRKNACFDF